MSDNFDNKNLNFFLTGDDGRPATHVFHRVCQMNFADASRRNSPYAIICTVCGGHQYRRKQLSRPNKKDEIEFPRIEELTINDPTPQSHPNRPQSHPNRPQSLPMISEDQILKEQSAPVPRKLTRKNMASAGVIPRSGDYPLNRRHGGGGGSGGGVAGSGSGLVGSG